MSLKGFLRGALVRSLTATALLGSIATLAHAHGTGRVAHGLIIKLKESSSSEGTHNPALIVGAGHRARLERLMEDAGVPDIGRAKLRPFGRTAQHLDFGRVLAPEEAAQLARKLALRPDVEWVVLNTRERRLAQPNDPFFPSPPAQVGQWWLYPVSGTNGVALASRLRGVPGVQTAWDRTTGGTGAIVAVLDTGIVSHTDLSGRILPGYDFVSDSGYANDGNGRDNDATDPGDWVSQADKNNDPGRYAACEIESSSWHGTLIAGVLAAATDNGSGVAGMNWNGRVLPVRVAGKCGALPSDIVDGMRWAAGLRVNGVPDNPFPARVINISFGGDGLCTPYQDTIDELAAMNPPVVVVAAAGNERGAVTRPAKCRGAIGVGAVNRDGFKTNYSNFGPELTVSTVGGDPKSDGLWGNFLGDDGLLSLDVTGTTVRQGNRDCPTSFCFAYLFGTSFSAPVAAGTVSLMLTVNPALTARQIIDGLQLTARPHVVSNHIGACSAQNPGRCICTTSTCGAGLLDTEQAVVYAQILAAGGSYVPPNRTAVNIDSDDVIAAAALGRDTSAAAPPPTASDDGGGALEPAWLLALAIAVLLVARAPRRRPR